MGELSTIRMTVETPMRGCVPNLGGPKLPRPSWRGRRAELLAILEFIAYAGVLFEAARAQRSGLFDLRAESIDLTIEHTIARIHRGAA